MSKIFQIQHKFESTSYRYSPQVTQGFADFLAFSFSILLYWALKKFFGMSKADFVWTIADVVTISLFVSLYWFVIFWFAGLYRNWFIRSPFDELFTIVKTSVVGCGIVAFILLIDNKSGRQSFGLDMLLYLFLFVVLSLIGRILSRLLQRRLRENGILKTKVLLLGSKEKLFDLIEQIHSSPWWGFQIEGVLLDSIENCDDWKNHPLTSSIEVLGDFSNIVDSIEAKHPHELIITFENKDHEKVLEILEICEERSIKLKILPDLYDVLVGVARTYPIYGSPFIEMDAELMKPWERFVKRFLDIFFSASVILFGLPVWIIVALLVKVTSKGPIFYSQQRVGKDGRLFMLRKFRSMVQNAEKDGPKWATSNDPRVTPYGKFMRKTHLDEIPQFLHILQGTMSLVGPRPERPFFVEKFQETIPNFSRRHKVRPGLTGYWQISYTELEETPEIVRKKLKYDLYYIENMSIRFDFEILLRTVVRVFTSRGTA